MRSVPVAAAGAYVPGGAAAYPSTAMMCCIPARVAGVERIAVASPPGAGREGRTRSCSPPARWPERRGLCDGRRAGDRGARPRHRERQAGRRDRRPRQPIRQEAKRQVFGRVGIDGIAGPSELMVILGREPNLLDCARPLRAGRARRRWAAGRAAPASAAAWMSSSRWSRARRCERETVADAPLALVDGPRHTPRSSSPTRSPRSTSSSPPTDAEQAGRTGADRGLRVRGPARRDRFGDYAAGSNHVLPTGGAGRFAGPLGPGTFRRQITTVSSPEAAAELAPAVATLANAEGFPVHGESARARTEREEGK